MYSFLVNLVHLFRVCVPNEYDESRYVVVSLPLFSSPSQKTEEETFSVIFGEKSSVYIFIFRFGITKIRMILVQMQTNVELIILYLLTCQLKST